MSYKSVLSNSLKSNRDTPQWIPKTESNVKLAGEEAKDRLYEPKHKKKLVRVLTVVAYIFSVSLAAIMLSLYYVFVYPSQIPKKQDETTTRHPGFGDHFNGKIKLWKLFILFFYPSACFIICLFFMLLFGLP